MATRRSPLSRIDQLPLLSRSEEHELACRYARTRDPRLERKLVEANLRLVVKLAHGYRVNPHDEPDLVQEGNLGLLQAVRRFDPHRGIKLSTYAAWWIRAYQLRFLVANHRLVKTGTTEQQRKIFFNLHKTRRRLEHEGIAPTTNQLAAALAVDEREVAEMEQRMDAHDVSLAEPARRGQKSGEGPTRLDWLTTNATRPDLAVEDAEVHDLVRAQANRLRCELGARDRALFEQRWLSESPRTLKAIGKQFGVSRERARQLERRILARLRARLGSDLASGAVA
jgi:RNA polymerase sigma-32 factor